MTPRLKDSNVLRSYILRAARLELSGMCQSALGSSQPLQLFTPTSFHTHPAQQALLQPDPSKFTLTAPSQGPRTMALSPPEWFPCLRMREAGVNVRSVRHKEDTGVWGGGEQTGSQQWSLILLEKGRSPC